MEIASPVDHYSSIKQSTLTDMSSRQTPAGFSISDLLIRIIPGAVLSAAVFLPLPGTIKLDYVLSGQFLELPPGYITLILVIFSLLSLVVGELIDLLRGNIVSVPYLFRRMVFDKTGERESLSLYQRVMLWIFERKSPFWILRWLITRLRGMTWDLKGLSFRWSTTRHGEISMFNEEPDAGFLDYYRLQMDFSSTFSDSRILYISLYDYLDGQMSSMTKQYQTAYNAFVNFRLASIGSIPILILHFGLGALTDTLTQQVSAVLFFAFLSLSYIGIRLFEKGYTRIEELYVESLLIEYLISKRSR